MIWVITGTIHNEQNDPGGAFWWEGLAFIRQVTSLLNQPRRCSINWRGLEGSGKPLGLI